MWATRNGVAAAFAASLLVRPALAEAPPGDRAAQVLRDAALGKDVGARLFALEKAPSGDVPGLEEAARRAAASPDRVEQATALEALARIGVARNRELFIEALGSPYRSVRLRALKALLTLSDPGLAQRFLSVLQNDPDPDLQALAAEGLGLRGLADGRAALARAIESGHPVVQRAAVRALVATGDLGFGSSLLARARSEVGPERRRLFALVALVPDPRLVPSLVELLEDPDGESRVAAAIAILSILRPPS